MVLLYQEQFVAIRNASIRVKNLPDQGNLNLLYFKLVVTGGYLSVSY